MLASLMFEFRAALGELITEGARVPGVVIKQLKDEIDSAKALCESFRNGPPSECGKTELFGVLIVVEEPRDWDEFCAVLQKRLEQIDNLEYGTACARGLQIWSGNILRVLEQRGRAEGSGTRSGWSL